MECSKEYFRPGDVVKGLFSDGHWYLAEVQQDNGDDTYKVAWFDGDSADCTKRSNEMRFMRFHEGLQSYQEAPHPEHFNGEQRCNSSGGRQKDKSSTARCQATERGHASHHLEGKGTEDHPCRAEEAKQQLQSPNEGWEEQCFDRYAHMHLGHCEDFEEAIEFEVCLTIKGIHCTVVGDKVNCLVAEVAIDPAPEDKSWPPCLRGAAVEEEAVELGTDSRFKIHRLPSGQSFLVALSAHLRAGGVLRSDWVRCKTLPAAKDPQGNIDDFYSLTRAECSGCPCESFELLGDVSHKGGSKADVRCRRCGCPVTSHAMIQDKVIITPGKNSGMQSCFEICLPEEACCWDERELSLFLSSRGHFHPSMMAKRRRRLPRRSVSARVSVVSPTTESRQAFHAQLWSVFHAQNWPEKELIVVETFCQNPSPFFTSKAKEDERLVYIPLRVQAGGDMYIGLKRNMCTHVASGEYIVNFDDDDLYAPNYISTMISAMQEQNCNAITLGSWFVFEASTGKMGHVDPKADLARGLCSPELADQWVFGYGFSYVMSRTLALRFRYPHCDLGEDYEFMRYIRLAHLQSLRGTQTCGISGDLCVAKLEGAEGTGEGDVDEAWVEEMDEVTCAQLYRNRITGEVRWDRPAKFTPQDELQAPTATRHESACQPSGLQVLDNAGVALYYDVSGMCLHTLHAKSTSGKARDLETAEITAHCEISESEFHELELADLKQVFGNYLQRFPRTGRASKFIKSSHAQFQSYGVWTPSAEELDLQSSIRSGAPDHRALAAEYTVRARSQRLQHDAIARRWEH